MYLRQGGNSLLTSEHAFTRPFSVFHSLEPRRLNRLNSVIHFPHLDLACVNYRTKLPLSTPTLPNTLSGEIEYGGN